MTNVTRSVSSARRGALHPAFAFLVAAALGVAVLAAFSATASAHFLLNVNIRVFHVVHERDRIRLLVRLPMPYLVADKLGAEAADGTRVPAPFTTNRFEDGTLVHYLDAETFRSAPEGLGAILSQGLVLEAGAAVLEADIGRVRAYPASRQAPFALLGEAEAALAGPAYPQEFEVTYVGDTIVDAELIYPTGRRVGRYSLRSILDPGLPGQEETANLILDHATEPPLIFRVRGLMLLPVEVSHSPLDAAWTFTQEGVRHILEGLDHVLFVLCLVLGAATLGTLAWRVTGFTIGHSVTLTLGFFGYVPAGAWFIPFVENRHRPVHPVRGDHCADRGRASHDDPGHRVARTPPRTRLFLRPERDSQPRVAQSLAEPARLQRGHRDRPASHRAGDLAHPRVHGAEAAPRNCRGALDGRSSLHSRCHDMDR